MNSWVISISVALSISLYSAVIMWKRSKEDQKKGASSVSVARPTPAPRAPQSAGNIDYGKTHVFPIGNIDYEKTRVVKTTQLTGEQAIPGLSRLVYTFAEPNHWIGNVKRSDGIHYDEIQFYGNVEGLQTERIATAQKIIPVLEALGQRGLIEVVNYFAEGKDSFKYWGLEIVYFGFDGTEPVDEFHLHFCCGPWDCVPVYYAKYRLNSENPIESTLLELGMENG